MSERTEDARDRSVVGQAIGSANRSAAEASWAQTRAVLRVIFLVLAVAAALWTLYVLEGVILLLILSVFFAYLVAPLVEAVRRPFLDRGRERLMPRGVAIAIVYLIMFGSVGAAASLLLPRLGQQLTELAQQAPAYLEWLRSHAQVLDGLYQTSQFPPTIRDAWTSGVSRAGEAVVEYLQGTLLSVVGWFAYVPWLLLVPIFAFFLLKDAETFRRSALQMLPSGYLRGQGDELFQEVNRTLAAYVRAQLTACLVIGIISTIAFAMIGVPYALVLGMLAGILEFIPLIGPLAAGVVAVLVAGFHSIGQGIGVFLFLIVLRIAQDYFIYPRIVGHGIHLHPLAVILAILIGAELGGVAGIFLAIPVVAIVSVVYRHWLEYRGSAGLVAELLERSSPVVKPSSQVSDLTEPESDRAGGREVLARR
jgi:predicted PurR-regulated permease PerM